MHEHVHVLYTGYICVAMLWWTRLSLETFLIQVDKYNMHIYV